MRSYNLKIFFLISIFGLIGLSGGAALLRHFIELSNQRRNLIQADIKSEIAFQPIQFPSFIDSGVLKAGLDYEKEDFLKWREDFISKQLNFIEVDLRDMILRIYERGELIKTMPVLTKGREGSWWETPSGSYKVMDKTINRFSSIGKVWMPYSIQFYGNFFIHGWPYYPDGAPVASTYSGGCVRLATEDAKTVFEFVDKDTPILVLDESDFFNQPDPLLVQKASQNLTGPAISANAALITDLDSGLVLLDKNSGTPLPVASLTKLMTAVTASELIYLEKTVKTAPLVFSTGKNYTAFDLLYPLLMQSSNQAASFLASFLGEKYFVEQMNYKAQSLGMNETVFTDTSGKDNGNVGTAKDLAKLAKYILEKRKFLFDISRGKNYLTFGPLNFGSLENHNEFYNEPDLIGVKNGQTAAAKQNLLTVWNFHLGQGGPEKRIAVIVLGSNDRKADTQTLLDWLKNNFNLQ